MPCRTDIITETGNEYAIEELVEHTEMLEVAMCGILRDMRKTNRPAYVALLKGNKDLHKWWKEHQLWDMRQRRSDIIRKKEEIAELAKQAKQVPTRIRQLKDEIAGIESELAELGDPRKSKAKRNPPLKTAKKSKRVA